MILLIKQFFRLSEEKERASSLRDCAERQSSQFCMSAPLHNFSYLHGSRSMGLSGICYSDVQYIPLRTGLARPFHDFNRLNLRDG